jgi:hypothetical protein
MNYIISGDCDHFVKHNVYSLVMNQGVLDPLANLLPDGISKGPLHVSTIACWCDDKSLRINVVDSAARL